MRNVRQLILRFIVGGLIFCLLIEISIFPATPANATIRQVEEAPGQYLYQSRQTIKDQHGRSWQVIAFKRILSDDTTILGLRLVGFPGTVEIARSQDLLLTNSFNEVLSAHDVSKQISVDRAKAEPTVGQYDMAPILYALDPVVPWKLSVPTIQGELVELWVSPTIVKEWQALLKQP